MILVLSFANNAHVERVLQHIHRDVTVMDTGAFSARAGLEARLGRKSFGRSLRLPDDQCVDLDDVGVVWRRRLRIRLQANSNNIGRSMGSDQATQTAQAFASRKVIGSSRTGN